MLEAAYRQTGDTGPLTNILEQIRGVRAQQP